MSVPSLRTRLFGSAALTLMAMGAHASVANAQTVSQPTPPEHYTLDARSVDLVSGQFNYETTEVVIGQPGAGGLVHARGNYPGGWRDSVRGTLSISGSTYTVTAGLESEIFTLSGSTFTPQSQNGATLSVSGAVYTFTTGNGVVARYSTAYCFTSTGVACTNAASLYEVVLPNGDTTNYHYVTQTYLRGVDPNGNPIIGTVARLQSLTNNRGYQLHFVYQSNSVTGSGSLNTRIGNWLRNTSVTGVNNAVDYCAPTAFSCTYSRTWPSVSYTGSIASSLVATDQSGRATTYTYTSSALTGVRFPGSGSDDIAISYTTLGLVSGITDASGAWTYTYSDVGSTRTTTASGPLNQQTVAVSDLSIGRATSVAVATGPSATSTWNFTYDSERRLQRTTNPEGDYVELTYDSRGNVIQSSATPKPGSGSAITTYASFPSSCSNPVTCNLPTSTTDARGNVTSYTWDSTHGGPLTVTSPAPTSGADQPQTRFTYAAQTAYFKNSSGSIVAAPSSVTLVTEVSACVTGTSCANAANEVRTTLAYGSTGVANNLQPTSASRGSGTSPAMAVTTITYTAEGDIATVDGPLSGTDDTTRYRYDAARQMVGVIGPDPDGGGAGLNRAQRATYDPRGQITKTEAGTTVGQSDSAWAAFSPIVSTEADYDSFGRLVMVEQPNGSGSPVSQRQIAYDIAGRVLCDTVRMKMDSTVPTDACTAETPAGSDGPDRIARMTYDYAGRPLSVTTADGLSEVVTESMTYTSNGEAASLTDGNGNVSVFEYDGFDRPLRVLYPEPLGGGTSTTDYAEVGYDNASNVITSVSRAGETTTIGYDNLNRVTDINAPSGTMDVSLTYDNLGRRLTSVGNGQTLTSVWDSLSRLTSETGPLGTMAYQYDAEGRITRITWPDTYYAAYEHDLYGAVTAVRENGATSGPGVLATYSYNNLGQPAGITRGNGASTSWSYDSVGRLTSLAQNPDGTSNDVTFGFGLNPAGQIVERTVSNSAYVYAPVTGTIDYEADGLNRVAEIDSAIVTYDDNQNATDIAGAEYAYDDAGRMISADVGAGLATFAFDPNDRLYQANVGSTSTRFQYAGAQLVGEYDGAGSLIRRHIPGLGLDGVITSYDGSGTTNRTWPLADERGSVIANTGVGGAVSNINRYDEYGVPAAGNLGRFQYTGQAWLAEAGVYHYRARAYLPQVGRFLQTDPIGYSAGANLYGYVSGDPINLSDPLGLEEFRVYTGYQSCTTSEIAGRPETITWYNCKDIYAYVNINLSVEVGQDGSSEGIIGYQIDVRTEGGHTLERHVGRSRAWLLARVNRGRFHLQLPGDDYIGGGLRRAGSFSSVSSANRLINATLSRNSAIVRQVASGQRRGAFVTAQFATVTGYEAYRSSHRSAAYVRNTFGVGVAIIHDPSSPDGFRVVTGYPRNP